MVRLEKVTGENFEELIELKIFESQYPFVADNTESLAEAYLAVMSGEAYAWPFAIYDDETLVGFLMIGYNEAALEGPDAPKALKDNYSLWRLMIDKRYQKQGFGREAVRLALEFIKTRPRGEAEACVTSYNPENEVAQKLYASFGFEENGEMDEDEIVAVLKLRDEAADAEQAENEDRKVFELDDPAKAAPIFAQWVDPDTGIRSCLDGVMGKLLVTDPEQPRSVMAVIGDFAFVAGEPDPELLRGKPERWMIVVPQNEAWATLMEENFPVYKRIRYAIKKDTKFDRQKLQAMVNALPEGYELRKIDSELYELCRKDEDYEDCVSIFETKEQFLELGRGWAVLKDGKLVGAASSYSRYRDGIEIEIDVAKEERHKGLGSAVAAKLILSCLDEGLYPSWDAANMLSVRLAEKLGYEFSHEYVCYGME